jgi:hypothetical protein
VKQEKFLRNVIEILITLLMLASLVVSAQHYGVVLNKHAGESLLTAWTIGIIFDLFHLAAILMAVIGKNKWFWFTALVTTLISFYYHHLFYNNFAFSVPFSLMLFSLATFKAYLMRTEEKSDSLSKKPGESEADFEARQMLQSDFNITVGETESENGKSEKQKQPGGPYICEICKANGEPESVYTYENPNRYNGHMKRHSTKRKVRNDR